MAITLRTSRLCALATQSKGVLRLEIGEYDNANNRYFLQLDLVVPLFRDTRIAEYRVLQVLGQGGFGTTYLAEDINLNKRFAIKEFTPHHLVRRAHNNSLELRSVELKRMFSDALQGFLQEGQNLARFNHENIVRVGRFLQANGTGYLVMDYEEGGSLRSLMRSHTGAFTEGEVRSLIFPLCDGLAQMHKRGLVHRDIKPDNVLIRLDGSPVLIDFGAAVDVSNLGDDELQVIATPGYAPPEQFDVSLPQGPWIDIYALGATLYELITGCRMAPAHLRAKGEEIVAAAELGRGRFSTQLLAVVDRCIDLEVGGRPQTLAELVALLGSPEDELFSSIVSDISWKMLQHFRNWATPNDGLYADEFSAFVVCFPIIDMAWRLGEGMPTRDSIHRILSADNDAFIRSQELELAKAGFRARRGGLIQALMLSRIDEYAAAYLLDRKADNWTYELLRQQAARNCLAPTASADIAGFSSLLEDVVDRARGRVKKAFNKALDPYAWIMVEGEWVRTLKSDG